MTAQDFSNMRGKYAFVGHSESNEDLVKLARRWLVLRNRKINRNLRVHKDKIHVVNVPIGCTWSNIEEINLQRYNGIYVALPYDFIVPAGQLTKSVLNDRNIEGFRVYAFPTFLINKLPSYIDMSEEFKKNIVFAELG